MKNRGVNVVISNNSWGGGGFSTPLEQAIKDANNAGILFVAAAGNEANNNDTNPSYPAGYNVDNVVSVAAIDFETNLASFSNHGRSTVDIAAPGVGIFSTHKNGGYATLNGTSMAAPHVSGALALLASYQPNLTNAQLVQRLYESGRDQATLSGVVRTGRSVDVNRMLRNQVDPVQEVPQPPLCPYVSQKIPYNPDRSADSASLVQQADELNFQTAVLGFDFPFYGENVTAVRISPNGVLYTKGSPGTLDYDNKSSAPLSSIAALHTDLKASADPDGVRVATGIDKTTIFWRAQFYNSESLGDVEVRTTLYKTGVIETFVSIPNTKLLNRVRDASTMGIKGSNSSLANTYAFNNNKVEHLLGVRYTPQCGSNDGSQPGFAINSFKAGKRDNGKLVRRISTGEKLRLRVNATGSSTQLLHARFNAQSCPSTYELNIQDGKNNFTTRIPSLTRRYRNLLLSLGDKSAKVRITNTSQESNKRGRLLSEQRLIRKCDSLYRRVK